MRHLIFSLGVASALVVVGCRADVKDATPYSSDSGLSFEIDDGTGIFYSKTKSYQPIYCGTKYRVRSMDIGQDNFDAISGLVKAGDIWTAKVEPISQCQVIDIGYPEQHYRFDASGRSISLDIGQCQRIDSAHEPYIKAIRQIIRTVSDRQKLRVEGKCVYF
jgi:hypothetical protein